MAGGFQQTPEQAARRAAELGELKARLNARVDSLVPQLVPGAMQAGHFWEAYALDGGIGTRVKFNRDGPMRGLWTDFVKNKGEPGRAGDMLELVVRNQYHGNFGEAMKALRESEGLVAITPAQAAQFAQRAAAAAAKVEAETAALEAKKRSRAQALWLGAVPIHGTPAEAYLQGRVPGWRKLERWPGSLRWRPDVGCPLRSSYPDWQGFPAMLASVIGPDGKIVACHRTYLDISGWDHASKSGAVRVHKVVRPAIEDVDEAGEIHLAHGPVELFDPARPVAGKLKSHKATLGRYADAGGYIPLRKGSSGKQLHDIPAGTIPHFAEGIEDALNYAVLGGGGNLDLWIGAAVSLANLGNIVLPAQAGGICILADRDPAENESALASFEAAVAAHQARRDDAGFVRAVWPAPGFKDFSDQAVGMMS